MTMTRGERRTVERLAEKYQRLAYELEADAVRLRRVPGFDGWANSAQSMSRGLGIAGRGMFDTLDGDR